MKILITGTRGLAQGLAETYQDHEVVCVRRPHYDIYDLPDWGEQFHEFDMVFNCAYEDFGQYGVLDYFAHVWENDPSKTIVNIGSMVTDYPRTERQIDWEYWPYRHHKQALQTAFSELVNSVQCDIRLINPGPIDTDMIKHLDVPKMSVLHCAQLIRQIVATPQFKRVDLWE